MTDDAQTPAAPENNGTQPPGTPGEAPRDPWAPPAAAPRSVHDQPTVTAMPGVDTPPQPWSDPFAPPATAHPQGEPVPPPPIAPDGPGQVPYGYPVAGYAYPPPTPASPAQGYYGWPGLPPQPSNGMGTASLVLGIIAAVVFCLWPIAIILGALALIFGFIARARAARGEATNPGQALAGIICGAAGIVLGLGMIAFLIAGP
ncbi:DUF4190 domain-containing protein [Streptomyces sp. 7R007]